MNTDNGALEFDAYINNERLKASIKDSEDRIKGFTNTVVKGTDKIDEAFDVTAENIRIQKDVIAQLEKELKTLNAQINKMSPGQAQNELKQQAAQVTAELNAEKEALKTLETEFKNTDNATKSYRTQLRELRDEMIRMEEAGQRDTDAYRKLQVEAGNLKDAIGDAQAQMAVMADDERMFKGIVSTIGGLTGAFSAVQGAAGLFADENENLNKIMLKVQSLMAITIGLQQVAEMLNKDSYFSVVILAKGKELLAATELKLATAMGVSTAAARVMMATLTFGLSLAITAIIVAISKLQSKTAEAKKSQDEFNKAAADAAYKPIVAINKLSSEWDSLGDNMKAKEKFIADNAKQFDELGVSINNVNEAENILVQNKDKFIGAMLARAKAAAAIELANAKVKEMIEKQMQLESNMSDKSNNTTGWQKFLSGVASSGAAQSGNYGAANDIYNDTQKAFENKNNAKIQAEIDKLKQESEKLFKLETELNDEANSIINSLGVSAEQTIEGSIKAVNEALNKLNEQYEKAGTDTERNKLLTQITQLESLLANLDKRREKKDDKKETDINAATKRALELRQIELETQEALLSIQEDGYEKQRKQLDLNQEKRLLDIDKQALQLLEKQQEAEKKAWEDNGKKGLFTPSAELSDENAGIISKMTNTAGLQYKSDIANLIKDLSSMYMTFNERRLEIDKSYNEQAEALSKNYSGNNLQEKLNELKRSKDAELSEINSQEADRVVADSKLLLNLFENAGNLSKKTAEITLKNTQQLLGYLTQNNQNFDLSFISKEQADKLKESPEMIENIQDAAESLKSTLDSGNDDYMFSGFVKGFKQLGAAENLLAKAEKAATKELKERFTAEAEALKEQALGNLLQGSMDVADGIFMISDAMNTLADATGNQKLKDGVEVLQSFGSIVKSIASGAASGGWVGAIVGGVTSIAAIIIQSIAQAKAEEVEFKQNRLDFLNAYNLLLLKVNESQDKVFNSDNLSNVIDAWKKAQEALSDYNDAVNSRVAIEAQANKFGEKRGQDAEEFFRKYTEGMTDLQFMEVKTKDRSAMANLFGKSDEYKSLQQLAPQLWGADGQFDVEAAKAFLETNTQINDAQRAQIQNVVDLKESYDTAMEAIDAEIQNTFGSLYDSLGDSLVNAIENGTNAWEDFRAAGYDVLQQLGKKLMMELFFNKKFEALTKQLEESYGAGDAEAIANQQAEIMQAFFSDIQGQMGDAEAFLKQWEEQMGTMGFSDESSSNPLAGAIKGASEETVSILSGYANAIRIQQLESINVLRNQLISLNKIEQNTGNLTKILDVLNKIAGSDSLRAYGL